MVCEQVNGPLIVLPVPVLVTARITLIVSRYEHPKLVPVMLAIAGSDARGIEV